MNTKTVPIIMSLAAAFCTCLVSILQGVEFSVFLIRFALAVALFYLIGHVVSFLLLTAFGPPVEDDEEEEENEEEGEEGEESGETEGEESDADDSQSEDMPDDADDSFDAGSMPAWEDETSADEDDSSGGDVPAAEVDDSGFMDDDAMTDDMIGEDTAGDEEDFVSDGESENIYTDDIDNPGDELQ